MDINSNMPHIWAIADLHLSFGVPNKSMEVFGDQWKDWTKKIEDNWRAHISPDDLVLLPGDISWAMKVDDAAPDLEWIHSLPGTKVLIRGNHDYWWDSLAKIKRILPSSCHLIQNNSYKWHDVAIGGVRLWDSPEYKFNSFIEYKDHPAVKKLTDSDHTPDAEKIFQRELMRLEASLKAMDPRATTKIAMIHYPPIGADLKDSIVSRLLEKYGVNICVFGHLHNVKEGSLPFGTHNHVHYALTSADYLNFMPLRIKSFDVN